MFDKDAALGWRPFNKEFHNAKTDAFYDRVCNRMRSWNMDH